MTAPDHRPYAAPGDLITAEDVATWLREQIDEWDADCDTANPRQVVACVAIALERRLDRERRQACRRGSFVDLPELARLRRKRKFAVKRLWNYAVEDIDSLRRGHVERALAFRAEGELAKIGGEPGGLARLRAAKDWAAHWERRALVAEAKLAEARDTEVALRMALHGDAASETIRRLRRRAQKAEGAIRAVERRAEGLCRDAERRVTEEARVRGLYRKKMRACSDMICESGLVQCETPARDGWPRCVEGRLEVLVPRLIAECERLRGEVTRLSGRASYDDVGEGGGANAG